MGKASQRVKDEGKQNEVRISKFWVDGHSKSENKAKDKRASVEEIDKGSQRVKDEEKQEVHTGKFWWNRQG
jgi:hypothetical protein